jgi:biopolymer transport protein ExbB/TolQ
MHCITVVGVVGIGIALERMVSLAFVRAVDARRFFGQIQKLVISDDLDRAVVLCGRVERAALARVVKAGLRNATYGPDRIDAATREAVAEVLPILTRRTAILKSLANVAAMLGLLGTVFGMVQGFVCVATVSAAHRSGALLNDISIALHSSAYGIAVALALLVAAVVLRSRTEVLRAELEFYGARLRTLLGAYVEAHAPGPRDPCRVPG